MYSVYHIYETNKNKLWENISFYDIIFLIILSTKVKPKYSRERYLMKTAKAQKPIPDFSVKEIAQQYQNKTALIGVTIMNAILAIAYVLEVFKNARSIGSYAVIAAFCILPCVFAWAIYNKQKDSKNILYVPAALEA